MRKLETYGHGVMLRKQHADIRIRYRVGNSVSRRQGLFLVPSSGCLPRKPLLYQSYRFIIKKRYRLKENILIKTRLSPGFRDAEILWE